MNTLESPVPAPSFLVDRDGWLPVPGVERPLGLRAFFEQARHHPDLAMSPAAGSGTWRILSVIAARITGLDQPGEGPTEWFARREQALTSGEFDPGKVRKYFDDHAGRWDLFDESRPWLQDAALRVECPKDVGINKLVFGRPAGANQVWHAHVHDDLQAPVNTADAVGHLIAYLFYGPSGTGSTRTTTEATHKTLTAGPLRAAISYHLVGRSVFESLIINLTYPDPSRLAPGTDLCPWEDPAPPSPHRPRPVAGIGMTLAGRFEHAVLLTPSPGADTVVGARITWAVHHPKSENGPDTADVKAAHTDPHLLYDTRADGTRAYRRADAARGLWRDLDGLLLHSADTARPLVVAAADRLPEQVFLAARIRAFGCHQDGKQKDFTMFTAATPPVLGWLEEHDPDIATTIADARTAAELCGKTLGSALTLAWKGIARTKAKPWPPRAAELYWPTAERVFWQVMRDGAGTDPAGKFLTIACDAYDEVTSGVTAPRDVRAVVKARGLIIGVVRKKFPVHKETTS